MIYWIQYGITRLLHLVGEQLLAYELLKLRRETLKLIRWTRHYPNEDNLQNLFLHRHRLRAHVASVYDSTEYRERKGSNTRKAFIKIFASHRWCIMQLTELVKKKARRNR